MNAENLTMRLDIGDIQEALKNHDSWMEDVSNTLLQMQEKEGNLTEDITNLKNKINTLTPRSTMLHGRRRTMILIDNQDCPRHGLAVAARC